MLVLKIFLSSSHFDRLASFLLWDFPLLGQRHVHWPAGSHAAYWSSPGGQVGYSLANASIT